MDVHYINYKTRYVSQQQVKRQWVVVDAASQTLGRLASQVAYLIRGKHKPGFTPHVNCGDHVIVLNADKVSLSGNKLNQKAYVTYSGYPGGVKQTTAGVLKAMKPKRMIEHAVKGMLPKNRLGRRLFHNLHVCVGDLHSYAAQKPTKITLSY